MWFDPHAKLADAARAPATSATTATQTPAARPVSQMSQVSQGPQPEITLDELARDIFEERATIRKYCGGQDRATDEREERAEVSRASKEIRILHWKDAADDITNPEVWR